MMDSLIHQNFICVITVKEFRENKLELYFIARVEFLQSLLFFFSE